MGAKCLLVPLFGDCLLVIHEQFLQNDFQIDDNCFLLATIFSHFLFCVNCVERLCLYGDVITQLKQSPRQVSDR